MIVCPGCKALFSMSGYSRHLAQTKNTICAAVYRDFDVPTDPSNSDTPEILSGPSNAILAQDIPTFPTNHAADVDDHSRFSSPASRPSSPFALDSREYDHPRASSPDDVPSPQQQHHSPNSNKTASETEDEEEHDEPEDEEEEEFLEADHAQMEHAWEPPRLLPQDVPAAEVDNDPEMDDTDANLLGHPARQSLVPDDHSRKPTVVHFPGGRAGQPLARTTLAYSDYHTQLGASAEENVYAPFRSRIDYEVACWAQLRGPGATAFTDLLKIDGVSDALGLSYKNSRELNRIMDKLPAKRPPFMHKEVVLGGEAFDIFYRDVMECIRALYGDPEFAQDLIFAPERHYADDQRSKRMYYDMHTAQWWWDTQKKIEREQPGGTVVPVILSSDKTQATMFRNKACYPVYMTIGNLPKDIRRKPSRGGWILLAYLPVTRLEHLTNKAARRRAAANLFHACLRHILEPLEKAGREGVAMASGDGVVHRVHPLISCYSGDYPEQVLVVGVKTGQCPKCDIEHDELGSATAPASLRDLEAVLEALALVDEDYAAFTHACQDVGIKPIYKPIWEAHHHLNIFLSITPDVLHQLYQGMLKHLLSWIKSCFSDAEIDARCRRLPPNHNIRLFMKGITGLSRVSGTEHDQICRFLLGIVVDIPLPGGFNASRLLRATRAMLDFIYLAQYPCHTTETLPLLDDALHRFHANKSIFVDLGIRTHFNLPKLHSLRHYIQMIQQFGTTDNYSTEYTERLHIDLAKDAYRATNHKDEYYQMTRWLERREKILWHRNFVAWRQRGGLERSQRTFMPPSLSCVRIAKMTKHPSVSRVTFDKLIDSHHAQFFVEALSRFVAHKRAPGLNAGQLERTAADIVLPFYSVPVFHKIKFHAVNAFGHEIEGDTVDVIHCHPQRTNTHGRVVPGRFDTALVKVGEGGETGVKGYRVAQVRAVFTLPALGREALFSDDVSLPIHLAYVEWFTPFITPDSNHGFYKVARTRLNGNHICSIVPVSDIHRSVHLIPRFGRVAPPEWSSSNVLEECDSFYVNPFTDRHAFVTIV